MEPIKVVPTRMTTSAPALNVVVRDDVATSVLGTSRTLNASPTRTTSATVVRKSSLKRRRILDDFESSDEISFDSNRGSEPSLNQALRTRSIIERTSGTLTDSEPAKKKGGRRVIEQEAESQSQVEIEMEKPCGKENEPGETDLMSQKSFVYEEEPDTEEESP